MKILNTNKKELAMEFVNVLNTSDSQARFKLIKNFLTTCAIENINPQEIIDNTFCGEYKSAFINMVDLTLAFCK